MQSKFRGVFLSFSSALLLSLAWYWHLSILIFFAFVPLLILEERLRFENSARAKLKLFGYAYLCFFTWNITVTWWIVYASFGGACMAFIFNALLMSIVFVLFSNIKTRLNHPFGTWLLIPIWIAWEHIHTLWDITWTWLTIGNVFAFNHNWVQWYEFTGTSGGTLWALAVNILVFRTLIHNRQLKLFSKPVFKIVAFIIMPILFSYLIYFVRSSAEKTAGNAVPVVVVQPNIDPYGEKFDVGYEIQFQKMLGLVSGKINPQTQFLALPETFVTGLEGSLNEKHLNSEIEIQWFRDSLISKFPDLKIVTGGNTHRFYELEKDITLTARKDDRSGLSYDYFNTGIYIDHLSTDVYHKSKLVPGVEMMPFPWIMKYFGDVAIDLGGTTGSLGKQDTRTVFKDDKSKTNIAPVICYESVYADYVARYVRNGANLIFIITNDGWWQDTPGYIQHLNYARLRAIENRREIARSANTGISCFIDDLGNISHATSWWKEAVIQKTIYKNDKLTFFSRFGDLLSYASVVLSMVLFLLGIKLKFSAEPAPAN